MSSIYIENLAFISKLRKLFPNEDPDIYHNNAINDEFDIIWDKKLYISLIDDGISISDFTSGKEKYDFIERKNMNSEHVFKIIQDAIDVINLL